MRNIKLMIAMALLLFMPMTSMLGDSLFETTSNLASAQVQKFPTHESYPNATGVYPILYALRDSVPLFNPFMMILWGFLILGTSASYYSYVLLTGKNRLFNSFLASSFATFIISVLFMMGELVDPYGPMMFIAMTIIALILVIFYRT